MITKNEILNILNEMTTEENKPIVCEYIDVVKASDEKNLEQLLQERGINNEQDVRNFINIKTTRDIHNFIAVNDLVSFGTTGFTLHLHVVPTSLKNMLSPAGVRKAEVELIDGLEKIKEMLVADEKYKNINKVYAVSNIIARPVSTIFEKLGFDVKSLDINEAKEDAELSRFYDRFKNGKKIGRAELAKEKMLSDEWSKKVADRKQQLEKRLGDKFLSKLESQVNNEVDENYTKKADDKVKKEEIKKYNDILE